MRYILAQKRRSAPALFRLRACRGWPWLASGPLGGRGRIRNGALLARLDGTPFLADGGLEASLVFLDDVELPAFAAFLADEEVRWGRGRYLDPHFRLRQAAE